MRGWFLGGLGALAIVLSIVLTNMAVNVLTGGTS